MKIIIANWKANPVSLGEAQELFAAESRDAKKYAGVQTVICPPAIYIEELSKIDFSVLGAQDLSFEPVGPFTGEVPAQMLKSFGVSHALVGHSDRRYKLGESDDVINKKIKAALEIGITPVLLIGEKNRKDDRQAVLEAQLAADLEGLNVDQILKTLIAYEPVWAISTAPDAEPDTPANTLEALTIIQDFLSKTYNLKSETCNPLYGGSVNQNNVANFLKHPEISGAVIGGASLRKEEFGNILKIVAGMDL